MSEVITPICLINLGIGFLCSEKNNPSDLRSFTDYILKALLHQSFQTSTDEKE